MHQAGDQTKQRSARDREPECVAHVSRVCALAFPIAAFIRAGKIRACARVPALVDAVEDAGELMILRAHTQQTIEPAAELWGRDLTCIVLAHGGEMARINEACLEKRNFVVDLDAIDV